jgi:two-component system sensor histidine kinase HydH
VSLGSIIIPTRIELILPKNDIELVCDWEKLSILLYNLILNAIQSIVDSGTIEISVEENNDEIVIQVKDSGKGIPKENIETIFEPLFTTKQHGTGLGLVSVKSIIESHGGTISVTSPPTIFTITLPKTLEKTDN